MTAFKLRGVAKLIAEEHGKYDEIRIGLVKKWGDKDEAGELVIDEKTGSAVFSGENYTEFLREINELGSIEVDVPKLHISELDGLKNFTGKDFLYLDELIDA